MVVDLGAAPDAGTVRGTLARALGDPSLVVGYRLPDTDSFVDDVGRPVEVPPPGSGRAMTRIDDAGERLAVLVQDATLLADRHLVESVAAAARIAVANARPGRGAGARRRARGIPPQDRRGRRRATPPAGAGASAGRGAPPRQRRRTARRSAASVPRRGGGHCARDGSRRRAPRAARVRFRIAVDVRQERGRVVVAIADDGVGGASPNRGSGLRGLADRVDALGGRLAVESPRGGGTRVTAELAV
jgi:hypothetical protein